MRLFAIGDVHGCHRALDTLVENIGFQADDTLVTLGDYVDGGPDSRRVLELLISLRSQTNLISLIGNHEIMMLRAKENQAALLDWFKYGGRATLASYNATAPADIPDSHWGFLRSCRRYFETADYFFV